MKTTERKTMPNIKKISILIVLLSIVLDIFAEVAPVTFTFNVPPTNGMFAPVYKTDEARFSFPEEDIIITEISFKGVFTNEGEVVAFHDALNIDYSASLDLVFHHTLLHQGSNDESYEGWAHFTDKDVTTWSHGAIMFGTSVKTTSFKPFGSRLHKDVADIYACIHAKNNKDFPVDFISTYEIEYEIVTSSLPDPRAMVAGWFSLPYFDPNDEAEVDESSLHVLVETDLVMRKDARLLGWVIHHHKWLYEIDLKISNETIFAVGKGQDTDPIPNSDGEIHWLKSDKYDHSKDMMDEAGSLIIGKHGTEEFGYPVYTGESLQMEVIAGNPTMQTKGPLGISLYFHCNDGAESLEHGSDLFSPYVDRDSPLTRTVGVDKQMQKKVDAWNKYIFASIDKKKSA